MARPLSNTAKHRRQYVIMCADTFFHERKFFVRTGYKSLLLKEYMSLYPDYNIHIYVLSGSVISNIK